MPLVRDDDGLSSFSLMNQVFAFWTARCAGTLVGNYQEYQKGMVHSEYYSPFER